ncbi:MAG: hypothetical protein K6G84_03955 [Lachnospiraceae bacterium]|nr:hypothetical protein [Lachnospiraceae bacterium]
MDYCKEYIEVIADFKEDGRMFPVAIFWQGRRYEIDHISRIERAASRKAGGVGILYTCMIAGRELHLYYEENYMWFMERVVYGEGCFRK